MKGNLMKGLLWLVALQLSFTTQIIRSILGTCSLALVKSTIGPLYISAISHHTGANYPSAWTVVIFKQRFNRRYICAKQIWICLFLFVWASELYQWSQSYGSMWSIIVSFSRKIYPKSGIHLCWILKIPWGLWWYPQPLVWASPRSFNLLDRARLFPISIQHCPRLCYLMDSHESGCFLLPTSLTWQW